MIRNGPYPSVPKIMRELELSERQVLRIIKDMKANYNAPIEYDRNRKGYCYLLDGFSISDISLNEYESFALQICNSFALKVFGGSKLFGRLYKGLSSLKHRAELFDSIKNGQILRLTKKRWESRELEQEIVLPIMVVMHEGFSWLLFYLKFTAFSDNLKAVNLNLTNFGVVPFNDITAINIYKDEHAKSIYIKNKFSFPGNTAADSTSEPSLAGSCERKGIRLLFTIDFPDLQDSKPYNVSIHFEMEMKMTDI